MKASVRQKANTWRNDMFSIEKGNFTSSDGAPESSMVKFVWHFGHVARFPQYASDTYVF
jgi:hypothetical protein